MRLRLFRIDVLGQRDAALEPAVLDLHLPVRDAARLTRPAALADDGHGPLGDGDVDVLGFDSGEVHDDGHRWRVFAPAAVDLLPLAASFRGDARWLPDPGEKLLG